MTAYFGHRNNPRLNFNPFSGYFKISIRPTNQHVFLYIDYCSNYNISTVRHCLRQRSHCEERSDEAIPEVKTELRTLFPRGTLSAYLEVRDCFASLAMTPF